MAPWPDQPCPHADCRQQIRDLLAEMVQNADQATPEFKAVLGQTPGGAITCPYYGSSMSPPDLSMTPEQWIAEEKLMPGALHGYTYVEDDVP